MDYTPSKFDWRKPAALGLTIVVSGALTIYPGHSDADPLVPQDHRIHAHEHPLESSTAALNTDCAIYWPQIQQFILNPATVIRAMPQEPIWALYNTNRVWRPSPATMVGPILSYAVYPQLDHGQARRWT